MILSSNALTEPLFVSQAGLSLHGVSLGGLPSTQHSLLTLSKSFCNLSVFSSRSLSLSCCAFSCFSSCFFFDSAIVLSQIWKHVIHLLLFSYQQCTMQTLGLTGTRASFGTLGGDLKRKRSNEVSGLLTPRLLAVFQDGTRQKEKSSVNCTVQPCTA